MGFSSTFSSLRHSNFFRKEVVYQPVHTDDAENPNSIAMAEPREILAVQ